MAEVHEELSLRKEIAYAILDAAMLEYWDDALKAADAVLRLPRIANALKAHERLVGKPSLGPSVSTNRRTPV